MSLKEQMLKAGLISQKEARQAAHQQRVRGKREGHEAREQQSRAAREEVRHQVEAEKAEHLRQDEERRAREAERARGLRAAQRIDTAIHAAYREGTIPNWEGPRRYHYAVGRRIELVMVSEDAGRRLEGGRAAIVVGEHTAGQPTLLNAGAARKLREVAPERILAFHDQTDR